MNRRFAKPLLILALMLGSASIAWALTPTVFLADEEAEIKLDRIVKADFADWTALPDGSAAVVDPGQQQLINKIYSQTLSRTYRNRDGYMIMLSIAYGRDQSDGFALHQPEVCYPAQGFSVLERKPDMLTIGSRQLPAMHLNTSQGARVEPITYWTVVGKYNYQGGVQKKLQQIRYAFSDGVIPDGMLIRMSSIDPDTTRAYAIQQKFAQDFVESLPAAVKARFTGVGQAS